MLWANPTRQEQNHWKNSQHDDFLSVSRSQYPVTLKSWHRIRVSRTGRLAFLTVDEQDTQSAFSTGSFNELSASQNLYMGGAPNYRLVSPYIAVRKGFQGCIQKVTEKRDKSKLLGEEYILYYVLRL